MPRGNRGLRRLTGWPHRQLRALHELARGYEPRMTSPLKIVGAAVAGLLVLAAAVVWVLKPNIKTFRYRLTVELSVDGEPRTASSVIEARYLIGDDGVKRWNSTIRGVAPIFDLGSDGTLIAALDYDGDDLQDRQTPQEKAAIPYRIRNPARAAEIPRCAYGTRPDFADTWKGSIDVPQNCYPMFMWLPPSSDIFDAKQLFYEQVAWQFKKRIAVVKVFLSAAPHEAILEELKDAPEWVVKMRTYFSPTENEHYPPYQKHRFVISPDYVETDQARYLAHWKR